MGSFTAEIYKNFIVESEKDKKFYQLYKITELMHALGMHYPGSLRQAANREKICKFIVEFGDLFKDKNYVSDIGSNEVLPNLNEVSNKIRK